MKKYKVNVTREGRWWMIEIPELDALTQARRIDEIEEMARSLVSVMTDAPASTFTFDMTIHIDRGADEDLVDTMAEVNQLRAAAAEAEEVLRHRMRQVAIELASADVPTRDIGRVLGVSHQRVSQLVDA